VPADATPFDMRGVQLSHHGRDCTFGTMLKKYRLEDHDPGLWDIMRIVHQADLEDERHDGSSRAAPAAASDDHMLAFTDDLRRPLRVPVAGDDARKAVDLNEV
jgi:hypothetical protein